MAAEKALTMGALRLAAVVLAAMRIAPGFVEPALAQSPALADAAKALIGTWEFSNADRDRRCSIAFKADTNAVGRKVEFERGCAGKFSFVPEIAAWSMGENEFLRLLDATGGAVLEFSEVESGIYEAPKPGEGILFIQKPNDAAAEGRTAAQTGGEWSVVRGGRPICSLNLSATPAGADFAVQVKPPCDAVVTRFGPASWRIDNGELVLKSARGQTWRFEEGDDAGAWRRIPATADAVSLVRK